MKRTRYVLDRRTGPDGKDLYDVVHLGPYVVAEGLKQSEAEALAKALNEEHHQRVDCK